MSAISNNPRLSFGEKTWTFASGKGGTGKTFIAASFAVLLAQKGKKVVLLDYSLGQANAHTFLGVTDIPYTLTDFLFGDVNNLATLLIDTGVDNLSLISGANDNLACGNLHTAYKNKLIRHTKNLEYDYLLIDVGSGSVYNMLDLFELGDRKILITTEEPSATEMLYRFVKGMLIRRFEKLAKGNIDVLALDQNLRLGSQGNLVERMADAVGQLSTTNRRLAELVEGELFDYQLDFIVNKCAQGSNTFLAKGVCDVLAKFYGFCVNHLGNIPFDLRISDSERDRTTYVQVSPTTETTARLSVALNGLLSDAMGTIKSDELTYLRKKPKNITELSHHEILNVRQTASKIEIENAMIEKVSIYSKGSVSSYRGISDEERRWMIDSIQNANKALLGKSEFRAEYKSDDAVKSDKPTKQVIDNEPANEITKASSTTRKTSHDGDIGNISGSDLRNIRLAKDITLESVSEITKVRKLFLEGIEEEDQNKLPELIFLLGYIKSYAKVLGLDPEEVAKKYGGYKQ